MKTKTILVVAALAAAAGGAYWYYRKKKGEPMPALLPDAIVNKVTTATNANTGIVPPVVNPVGVQTAPVAQLSKTAAPVPAKRTTFLPSKLSEKLAITKGISGYAFS